MKIASIIIYAAVIATVLIGTAKAASDLISLDGKSISIPEMEATTTSIMEKAAVTGLSCAIINDSKIVYCRAFGLKNKKNGKPNNEQTVFASASLAKPIFAYLVMLLVEEGVFKLDKPLNEYLSKPLPDYKKYANLRGDYRYKQITARLCLTHSAGLAWRGTAGDNKITFIFNPGQRCKYSGEGINLLQMVVEEVTGKNLEELARAKVFEPLGMTRTSFVWQDVWKENVATPHDQQERPKKIIERREAIASGASMFTTAGDYARFLVALITAEGKRKATIGEMLRSQVAISSRSWFSSEQTDRYEPINLSWCLGWVRFDTKQGRAFFHIGRGFGRQNFTVTYADKGIGVVFMSNSNNFESVARELAEATIGDTYSPFDWCGYPHYDPSIRKESPLHLAAYFGQIAIVKLLLVKGTDVEALNRNGRTALGLAIENGHTDVVGLLREHISRSGNSKEIMTFFDYAAVGDMNDMDQFKSFISNNVDVNMKTQRGVTALHWAAYQGRRDVAECLISNGAGINTKDNNGFTPLHVAVIRGQKDIVELLITKGVDINVKNNAGQTPLKLATNRKRTEVLELLKKHGAKE
ncbi:MAG: serine hydrolase [Planctomycetota bacterium]|jgi:CubicO group peptidase (beta-lactamase class C family)